MKHILLFLLFLPPHFFAQVQHDCSLPDYVAKSEKIKSVTATTLFIAARDNKPDTGSVTLEEYDRNGNITLRDYHNTLDKNNYESRSEYFYKGNMKRVTVQYENGLITDSIVFTTSTFYINYYPGKNKYVRHEIKDSILTETAISGTDSTIHTHKVETRQDNVYDDDFYPGAYARKISIYDSIKKVDSCIFLDKKGKRILSIVNQYDNFNHVIESDYYNKKDKNYRIYSERYNPKMNMVINMPRHKFTRTYQVNREYDNKGLMITEKRISSRKSDPVIVINYAYTYY
ncbi:MAG: hypothetical protein ABIQ40_02320 [Bacteroidia bacterium]